MGTYRRRVTRYLTPTLIRYSYVRRLRRRRGLTVFHPIPIDSITFILRCEMRRRRRSGASEGAPKVLLDAIVCGEALLEGLRELVGEPAPRLLADLVLEPVQDFVEHLSQVIL